MYRVYERGQTHFQIGENTNLFDGTYVGNVPCAHLLAVDKLDVPAPPPLAMREKMTTNLDEVGLITEEEENIVGYPLPSILVTTASSNHHIPTYKLRPLGPYVTLPLDAEKIESYPNPIRPVVRSRFDPLSEHSTNRLKLRNSENLLQVAGQALSITNSEPCYFWDLAQSICQRHQLDAYFPGRRQPRLVVSTSGLRRSTRTVVTSKTSAAGSKPRATRSKASAARSKPPKRLSRRSGKQRADTPGEVETSPPQMLYLRVNKKFLNLLPEATDLQPQPQPIPPVDGTTGNLNIIVAGLSSLDPYTGGASDWLLAVARLILDPHDAGSLYVLMPEESVQDWLEREIEDDLSRWTVVQPGQPLRATIYELRPANNAHFTPVKMSIRHARSMTSSGSANRATLFRDALLRRDTTCIITGAPDHPFLVASHLIPRRLGDAGVQAVVQRFTGSNDPVDIYDPRLGVLLSGPMDAAVDVYWVGFWPMGNVRLLILHALCINIFYTGMTESICPS